MVPGGKAKNQPLASGFLHLGETLASLGALQGSLDVLKLRAFMRALKLRDEIIQAASLLGERVRPRSAPQGKRMLGFSLGGLSDCRLEEPWPSDLAKKNGDL